MLWQLVVVAAVLAAVYYRWSRRRLYRLAREIPSGIKEYPIVGHAYKFLGSSEGMTDPEAIGVISKACLDKDKFTMKFLRTALGNVTVSAPVSIWHRRRKILAPFFKLHNLNLLVPVFQKKSSIMADLMRDEAGGGDFAIWKYMTTYTFDTVFEIATETQMNSQEDPDHFILRAIDEMTHMVAKRMLQPWLHPDFIYKRLAVYKQFQAHLQRCWNFTDEIIQSKRTELRAVESQRKKDDGATNFIEALIQSSGGTEKGYSDIELREETMAMVVAGNDIPATGASFAAVLLSRYPHVQDRVYQELKEVFGDTAKGVTWEDLSRLKYLEAVIKETLRLYPPVPVIVREVYQDVVLRTTLVDGTGIAINIWGTHRNPEYWGADAELFRPERFLEGPLRHPAQFIPFSYSVRNCIGASYAMLSMKTALANLLRRYKLLPPANMAAEDLTKPLRVKFDLIMKALDNFIVRIEERKK